MCVFMEAWSRCFISGYKETLEWADSKYSSKRTLGKMIIKNHPQNLYTNKEVTTLFSFKRRGGGFQNKWAASQGSRKGTLFPFWMRVLFSQVWCDQHRQTKKPHTWIWEMDTDTHSDNIREPSKWKREAERKKKTDTQTRGQRDKQIKGDRHRYKHTFLTNPSAWPVCTWWEGIAGSAEQGIAE